MENKETYIPDLLGNC